MAGWDWIPLLVFLQGIIDNQLKVGGRGDCVVRHDEGKRQEFLVFRTTGDDEDFGWL